MQFDKLSGGMAVGAAIVILLAHGKDFTLEEITILSAGVGTVVTYLAGIANKLLGKLCAVEETPTEGEVE